MYARKCISKMLTYKRQRGASGVAMGGGLGGQSPGAPISPKCMRPPSCRHFLKQILFKHTNFGLIDGPFENLRKWMYRMRE